MSGNYSPRGSGATSSRGRARQEQGPDGQGHGQSRGVQPVSTGLNRSPSPPGGRRAEIEKKPDPQVDPKAYEPPKDTFDQDDLPIGTGDYKGSTVCPHCLRPYSKGHSRSWSCSDACGCCGTRNHQGQYCPRRYLSFSFYHKKLRRMPYVDEGIKFRPGPSDAEILVQNGYKWALRFKPSKATSSKREADGVGVEDNHDAKRYKEMAEKAEERANKAESRAYRAEARVEEERKRAIKSEAESKRLRALLDKWVPK